MRQKCNNLTLLYSPKSINIHFPNLSLIPECNLDNFSLDGDFGLWLNIHIAWPVHHLRSWIASWEDIWATTSTYDCPWPITNVDEALIHVRS